MSETTKAPETGQTKVRWGFLVAIALTIVAADQVTKFVAVKHLTQAFDIAGATTLGEQVRAFVSVEHPPKTRFADGGFCVPVVRAFWSHCYAENPGAAFSFARSWPANVRIPFFHVVTLLAVGMMIFYYRKLQPGQHLLRWALPLVLGGAVGNLIDRIIRGYVVDFIDWHLNDFSWQPGGYHWPTFNVADTGISIGIGLIALDSLVVWLAQRKAVPATKAA